MAQWADVEQVVTSLPDVVEGTTWGNRAWKTGGRAFAWARPLTKKERTEVEGRVQEQLLAVVVPDLSDKEALVAAGPWFTTAHFDGHAIVLVELPEVEVGQLREVLEDGWRAASVKR